MGQVIFLDTNVILDYLENRNKEVKEVVTQLLDLHKEDRIVLTTSIFNIAELIDKEFQIYFIKACISERMSGDEIISKLRRDRKLYKQVAERNKSRVEKKIRNFIFKNKIEILSPSFDDPKDYKEIYGLIYNYQLRSQDALIVATAILNNATYFLSNDSELVNTIDDLTNSFNLRNRRHLENFRDNVLEAI